ncbi:hypothetical protein D3C77_367000 [compost metagenome]
MSMEEFQPRPPFSIDWERQYNVGPSDEHLHAIGQFIASYSMVEWQISGLFAYFLKLPIEEAQRLAVDTNLSMAGKLRYVQGKVGDEGAVDAQTSSDLLATLKAFDNLSKLRHKIVHWQWGLNEGATATMTDLIRPRTENSANASISIEDLRQQCHYLMRIFQAIVLNGNVLKGLMTRAQILAVRTDTSPEKLFRP